MRKLWYAGATVAGGIFLFGAASPAQADLLPGTGTVVQQADQRLAYVLGEPNGAMVENPLRYSTLKDSTLGGSPVVRFRSGTNSPDLNPMLPGKTSEEEQPGLPGADVVDSLTTPDDRPVAQFEQLPFAGDLLGDGGLIPGLLPSTGTSDFDPAPAGDGSDLGERPWARQAEGFSGGMPLLGGLGGMLPVNSLPRLLPAGAAPDTTGLPTGGLTVIPADSPDPGFGVSGTPDKPAKKQPKPAATPDDPRLHEEPIDGEHRSFSTDVRPVAGVDRQYD